MNIPHARKLKVALTVTDRELMNTVRDGGEHIVNLANLEELLFEERETEHRGAVTDVAGSVKIFVFLGGMIDVSQEKSRLESKLKKVTRDHTMVLNKLNNRDFMEKASEEVVEKEKGRYEELRQQLAVIEDAMKKLRELGN
jgi:valyl-tRNA synthetase